MGVKVLNLYAGLGGNRKFWDGVEVTAVEIDPKLANIYARLYPDDDVITTDAHQYLLDRYTEFDFIWSSPPCQSHSKMNQSGRNRTPRFPDMKLYQEILFLEANHKGKWVVENVKPYYKPLVPAVEVGRHLIWSNFQIGRVTVPEFKGFIKKQNLEAKQELMDWLGIHFPEVVYHEGNHCPTQVLRNCVHPEVGRQIFDYALNLDLFGMPA